jgi:hypothetical protein
MGDVTTPYAAYADVPYYRKQRFFWLMWLIFSPIAIGLLLTGDVYYQKKGQVREFGILNRIVAGIIAIIWTVMLFASMGTK